MSTRPRPEVMIGNTIVIQPLEIPDGPYFGRFTLSVYGRHMPLGELPADLGLNHQVWRLTASLDERDSLIRVDPVRQMGNLLVASSTEGVRQICDEWIDGLTTPFVQERGPIIACTINGQIEEHPVQGHAYQDFIRRYDIARSGLVGQ